MAGLIVTRHPGERVRILLPDGREVWVTTTDRNSRLVFEGPRDVRIDREEAIAPR